MKITASNGFAKARPSVDVQKSRSGAESGFPHLNEKHVPPESALKLRNRDEISPRLRNKQSG
jgi:hypothetical protein